MVQIASYNNLLASAVSLDGLRNIHVNNALIEL